MLRAFFYFLAIIFLVFAIGLIGYSQWGAALVAVICMCSAIVAAKPHTSPNDEG